MKKSMIFCCCLLMMACGSGRFDISKVKLGESMKAVPGEFVSFGTEPASGLKIFASEALAQYCYATVEFTEGGKGESDLLKNKVKLLVDKDSIVQGCAVQLYKTEDALALVKVLGETLGKPVRAGLEPYTTSEGIKIGYRNQLWEDPENNRIYLLSEEYLKGEDGGQICQLILYLVQNEPSDVKFQLLQNIRF